MKFGMWNTPPCYSPAPFMLRLCSHLASFQLLPCPTPALLNPSSYPATSQLLPCAFLAPAQFLPSSPPFLPCFALLCLALLLPSSCPTPPLLLLLPCSYFANHGEINFRTLLFCIIACFISVETLKNTCRWKIFQICFKT